MNRDMVLLHKKTRDMSRASLRDLDSSARAGTWATIFGAAYQVGEIAARQ
jgi:hypothetical protein